MENMTKEHLTEVQKYKVLNRTSFKNVSGNWQFKGDMTPERFIKILFTVLEESGSVATPKEEEDEWLCPTCGNKWGSDEGKYCSSSWHLATPLIQKQVARLQSELAALRQQLKERDELIANLKQDIVRLVEDVNKAYEH